MESQNQQIKDQKIMQLYQQILCTQGLKSQFICLNQDCQRFAFICRNKNCQCRKNHKKCLKLELQDFLIQIFNKVTSTKQLENYVNEKIDKAVDELSNLRDKIIAEINQKLKYYGLSQQEYEFAKAIQKRNYQKITGKHVWHTLYNISNESIVNDQFKKFQDKVDQAWKKHEQIVKIINQSSFKELKNIQELTKAKAKVQLNNNQLFIDSKLVKTEQDEKNIKGFFGNKRIDKAKLIYRASQSDFSALKFHQKCDNVPNTITFCQTQFGKIIGGFTPIIWNKVENNQYATDLQKRSFVFSLSTNQKFTITSTNNQKYQIRCYNHHGPAFGGGHDLFLSDKANQSSSSYANIGHTYVNSNYRYNRQISWKKFIGQKTTYNFKVKQWEVWQLHLQQI